MINITGLLPRCQIACIENPVLGAIHIGATPDGIVLIDLLHEDEFFFGAALKSHATEQILRDAQTQLSQYFEGTLKKFDLPLDWSGTTSFQRKVLTIANQIPYGEVRTYGEIARLMGMPNGSRAVGNALANNPIAIVIPCHRVIAADGNLQGYAARNSIQSKAWLLQHEGVDIERKKLG
jgi:methylated-DNA-[protein]-cysteine S-methyltransferase